MGRQYGGGVLELTPNELKNLPVFYTKTNQLNFKKFSKIVEEQVDIFKILNEKLKFFSDFSNIFTKKEILQLNIIYKKLINNRIRNND